MNEEALAQWGGCCAKTKVIFEKKYFRWVVYLYYATVLHSFAGPYWNISVKMVVEKQ